MWQPARQQIVLAIFIAFKAIVASKVPEITFDALSSALRDGNSSFIRNLQDPGGRLGVFAITHVGESYQQALVDLLEKAPYCMDSLKDLPVLVMNDGSSRKTFAVSSDSSDHQYPQCLRPFVQSLSDSFDSIDSLIVKIVELMHGGHQMKYRVGQEVTPLAKAPTKSHVHVYRAAEYNDIENYEETTDQLMVPFHVDNGMFLLITPFPGHGLQVKLSDGTKISTQYQEDTVLVLMGRGLTDWLLQNDDTSRRSSLFAVPHAVPELTGTEVLVRTVFARMKVAPGEAVPVSPMKNHKQKWRKFDEVFQEKESHKEGICITNLSDHDEHSMHYSKSHKDPWAKAMDAMCENGTAYCWMGCRPLPSEDCSGGTELECFSTDSGLTCDTNPDSEIMDTTCEWQCRGPAKPLLSDYCNGGMDMLMSGFETSKGSMQKTCVILFFKAWTLNTQLKFAMACIGVFLMGVMIEFLIYARRRITSNRRFKLVLHRHTRRLVVVCLFGSNLILGYLAMLVAMTYSVELFACVVLGLIVGHLFFNTNSTIGESIDPCCASQQMNSKLRDCAPITRTPCDAEAQFYEEVEKEEHEESPTVLNHANNSTSCCYESPSKANDVKDNHGVI